MPILAQDALAEECQTVLLKLSKREKFRILIETGDWAAAGYPLMDDAVKDLLFTTALHVQRTSGRWMDNCIGSKEARIRDGNLVYRILKCSALYRNNREYIHPKCHRYPDIISRALRDSVNIIYRDEQAEGSRRADGTSRCMSVAEYRVASLPTSEPVVEGLIAAGETILIAGRPKVGKSRFILQLALSLGRGESFLGYAVNQARRVLIIDLENRRTTVQERLGRMAPDEQSGDENVFIWAADSLRNVGIGLRNEEELRRFRALVAEASPDVLIIDPWRLLVGLTDENKSAPVLDGLKRLAELKEGRPNLVIVIVHHLRKQGIDHMCKLREDPHAWLENVSGHYALVGHCDACYGLERESRNGDDELIVFGGVARNAAATLTVLEEDEDTLLFSTGRGDAALYQVLTPVEKKIYEVAKEIVPFTFRQLLEAARTRNKKAVSSLLGKAVRQRIFARDGQGKGVRYRWLGER
jgi:hypothetical protein